MDILSWPLEKIRDWLAEYWAALRAADESAARLAELELTGEDAAERDAVLAEYHRVVVEPGLREKLTSVQRYFDASAVGFWPVWLIAAVVALAFYLPSVYAVNAELDRRHDRHLREPDPQRRLPDDPIPAPRGGWGWVLVGVVGGAGLVYAVQHRRKAS